MIIILINNQNFIIKLIVKMFFLKIIDEQSMGPLFWTDRNECFPQLGYRKTNYWSLLNTTMSRLVCRPPFRLCENGVPHTIVKTTIVKKKKKTKKTCFGSSFPSFYIMLISSHYY